jgi:hypothetical protein
MFLMLLTICQEQEDLKIHIESLSYATSEGFPANSHVLRLRLRLAWLLRLDNIIDSSELIRHGNIPQRLQLQMHVMIGVTMDATFCSLNASLQS